jgi:chromosome partitioning protein
LGSTVFTQLRVKAYGEEKMNSKVYGRDRFSAANLETMFRAGLSKTAMLLYEENGRIPMAKRVIRGSSAYRSWCTQDLSAIGKTLGYMKTPVSTKVVSIFSLKGGTGKTTLAFQMSRIMALHGIRCLVVGLDAQESVTQTINKTSSPEPEDDYSDNNIGGVYHILKGEVSFDKCILPTDIPCLSYIPETIELSVLDRFLKNSLRKEYIIGERLVDPIRDSGRFDVIVFDCNPAWTDIVTSALATTDILVSPLGCDINSYKAARIFVDLVREFQVEMRHFFSRFFIVPSMLENNRLSHNILARYRLHYEEFCSVAALRKAISVQEANVVGLSLMETCSKSPVYGDLSDLLREIGAAVSDQDDVPQKKPKATKKTLACNEVQP